jgi:hypothetical protein
MDHPFGSIQPERRKHYFSPLFVATILMMVIMNVSGAPLNNSTAPLGIISFEFAGSIRQAETILSSWDQEANMHVAFSLGLDYLFMVIYSTTIGLGCFWAGEVLRGRKWPAAWLGIPLAWSQWLAAVLDGVENIALVRILFGTPTSPWPELAMWCAAIKFGLIILGILYTLLGLIGSLVGRLRS